MRKLSLLIFALLVLGCSNENPVSERDEEIAELRAVVAELSKAVESLDPSPPVIASGNVQHGDIDVDPESLNVNGIKLVFDERISVAYFALAPEGGPALNWIAHWSESRRLVTLTPPNVCSYLSYGKTYTLQVQLRDIGCWESNITITFSTKGLTVGQFVHATIFFEPVSPAIVSQNIEDGAVDVDPESLHLNGITFTFDESVCGANFEIAPKGERALDLTPPWSQIWSEDRQSVTLTPPNACTLLRYGETYILRIHVWDKDFMETITSITFSTKATDDHKGGIA